MLAFDPHPAAILAPDRVPPRLTSFADRAAALQRAGADRVEPLVPTPELLGLSPEAFVDGLVERFAPVCFVEGPDFRFGRKRTGTLQTLESLGRSRGFTVEQVEPVFVALTDQTVVRASSTMTRWLLGHGRVRDASAVLGKPYTLAGVVERGQRRGRAIGIPTANLGLPADGPVPPADGVYACRAMLPDGSARPAAVSVGTNPTFDGSVRTVEAHVLGIERDGDAILGLPEYGWPMTLEFIAWVRDQSRFSGVDELVAQLHRDLDRVGSLMHRPAFIPEAALNSAQGHSPSAAGTSDKELA